MIVRKMNSLAITPHVFHALIIVILVSKIRINVSLVMNTNFYKVVFVLNNVNKMNMWLKAIFVRLVIKIVVHVLTIQRFALLVQINSG